MNAPRVGAPGGPVCTENADGLPRQGEIFRVTLPIGAPQRDAAGTRALLDEHSPPRGTVDGTLPELSPETFGGPTCIRGKLEMLPSPKLERGVTSGHPLCLVRIGLFIRTTFCSGSATPAAAAAAAADAPGVEAANCGGRSAVEAAEATDPVKFTHGTAGKFTSGNLRPPMQFPIVHLGGPADQCLFVTPVTSTATADPGGVACSVEAKAEPGRLAINPLPLYWR